MKPPALGLVVVTTCMECGGLRQAALMPGPEADIGLDREFVREYEAAGLGTIDDVRALLLPCATCTRSPDLSVMMPPKLHARAWREADLPLSPRDCRIDKRQFEKQWTRMGLDARPVMMWRSLVPVPAPARSAG